MARLSRQAQEEIARIEQTRAHERKIDELLATPHEELLRTAAESVIEAEANLEAHNGPWAEVFYARSTAFLGLARELRERRSSDAGILPADAPKPGI